MAIPNVASADESRSVSIMSGIYSDNTRPSSVSWGAIIAGAAAAAALSMILLILGTGLGLSSVSPWSSSGIDATTFGVSTILWVTLTQLLASGMGGYIAGRLRSNWLGKQTDEAYFVDSAHGFLAWAVASLATATLLTSVIGSIVSNGMQAGATVAASAAEGAASGAGGAGSGIADAAKGALSPKSNSSGGESASSSSYYVDSLFRKSANGAPTENKPEDIAASSAEVTGIFMHTIRSGPLPAEDLRYVAQIVSQRTGLPQQEAEKRVSDTYSNMQQKLQEAEVKARDAADKARKASAYTALWMFISLLIGAFVASFAAIYGGRQRDDATTTTSVS